MARPGRTRPAEHFIRHGLVVPAVGGFAQPLKTNYFVGAAGPDRKEIRARTDASAIQPYAAQRQAASLVLESAVTPYPVQFQQQASQVTTRRHVRGSKILGGDPQRHDYLGQLSVTLAGAALPLPPSGSPVSGTFSYTSPAGANQYMLIAVGFADITSTGNTVTWKGAQSATLLLRRRAAAGFTMEWWGLVAPASGSGNVAVTLSSGVGSSCGVMTLSNVDQVNPFYSQPAGNSGAGSGVASTTYNGPLGCLGVCTAATASFSFFSPTSSDTACNVFNDGANIAGVVGPTRRPNFNLQFSDPNHTPANWASVTGVFQPSSVLTPPKTQTAVRETITRPSTRPHGKVVVSYDSVRASGATPPPPATPLILPSVIPTSIQRKAERPRGNAPSGQMSSVLGGYPAAALTGFTGKRNIFEGGTPGVAITSGNSGGASLDPFGTVVGNVTYANAQSKQAVSANGFLANGGTLNTYVRHDYPAPSTIESYGRVYLYLTSYPSSQTQFVRFNTNAGTPSAFIRLAANGRMSVCNAANTIIQTAVNVTPLNQWVRVEWRLIPSTTVGEIQARIWFSAESAGAPDEDLSGTAQVLGADTNRVLYGIGATVTALTADYSWYMDEIVTGAQGWPGPSGTPANSFVSTTTPVQTQFVISAALKRTAERPRGGVITTRTQALVFTPPQVTPTAVISLTDALKRQAERPRGGVSDSYDSARAAASAFLESLVSPPKVRTILQAARSPRRTGRPALVTRSQGLIITPPPPAGRTIEPLIVETHSRVARRVGAVVASYHSQRGGAATTLYALVTPTRQPKVVPGRRPKYRPNVGRFKLPRPTFITGGTPPSIGTLALIDPSAYNHVVASTLQFQRVLVGSWTFSASYSSGGEIFVVPTVDEHVAVAVPPVAGYTFAYKNGRLLAYTGAGAEVAGGTNLSSLGVLTWYGLFR